MYTLAAFTSLLALAAASPMKRSCSYFYPSLQGVFDTATPDVALAPLKTIESSALAANGPFRLTALQFNLPSGVQGPCSLEYNIDPAAQVTSVGRTSLGIYKTSPRSIHPDTVFHLTDAWNTSPAVGFQWGSFTPVPGAKGTINSETCQETLSYYVSAYEPWIMNGGGAIPGTVSFLQNSDPGAFSGIRMRTGC